MYGMPLAQALLFVAMAAVLVAAVQWRVHAFVAIVVLASVFGATAGFSMGLVGKSFGNGFSQTA